jgi:hypothetical protein
MKKLIFITLIGLFVFEVSVYGQNEKENHPFGVSSTIQSGQLGISMPVWLGEKFVLAPAVDFKYAEKVGTDISIGVAPRFYLKKEKLAPYWGFRIGTLINIPASDNEVDDQTKLDILAGLNFGGEYYLSDRFSVGIEAQGNLTKSDKNSGRFGNPGGVNINLATLIFATMYF